ncbi:MAG: cytochrome c maturation protein CcmE [Myxococcales bacterium]|nr:cytochrome c maturation protein CcmE [Myxococcales bacterium]
MGSQTVKIVLSVIVLGGAVAWLVADTLAEPEVLTYFHGADVVLAKADEMRGQRIRMGGHVVKGSILQKPGTLEYQFQVKPVAAMVKHPDFIDSSVPVRYEGIVPDTFKDDAEVIVTGVLGSDNLFKGSELIAKCPSKYEAAEKNEGTY